jgi:hypothetical protein
LKNNFLYSDQATYTIFRENSRVSETLPTSSIIDPVKIQVYRESLYRVKGKPPMTLRVDQQSKALAKLHQAENVTSSAFISACNPYSQQCDDYINAWREISLANDLNDLGLSFLSTTGRHPPTKCTERGFLVLGISLKAAKALGVKYEQNAILWADTTAAPQLILLR